MTARIVSADEAKALADRFGSFARPDVSEQRTLDLAHTVQVLSAELAALRAPARWRRCDCNNCSGFQND